MPIKMVSKKSHTYGTRRLVAGDEFDVRGQSDKRLMTALGRAEEAKPKAEAAPAWTPPARTYTAAKKVAAKTAAKKTSGYFGRSLVAGDGEKSED